MPATRRRAARGQRRRRASRVAAALPARLGPHPRILFVGINPGLRSGALGHHFAGPGNPFWRLLYAARLVPEPLGYADDARLVEWRLALTNIVPRATLMLPANRSLVAAGVSHTFVWTSFPGAVGWSTQVYTRRCDMAPLT